MRVIAGSAGGRVLHGFKGWHIRPTSDRVKEAVFSSLMMRLEGSRVADLFAGTGALGIEALSRGAKSVEFVEINGRTCGLIYQNLITCGWAPSDDIRITRMNALSWISAAQKKRSIDTPEANGFDILFADPPYRKGLEEKVLIALGSGDLLSPGGILVVESDAGEKLPETLDGLYLMKNRVYGDTKISYYLRRNSSELTEVVQDTGRQGSDDRKEQPMRVLDSVGIGEGM